MNDFTYAMYVRKQYNLGTILIFTPHLYLDSSVTGEKRTYVEAMTGIKRRIEL